MFDITKELDTIATEHRYMSVGDPVPVNQFDQHELHIDEHKKHRAGLNNDEETVLKQAYMNMLDAHISLHEQYMQRI